MKNKLQNFATSKFYQLTSLHLLVWMVLSLISTSVSSQTCEELYANYLKEINKNISLENASTIRVFAKYELDEKNAKTGAMIIAACDILSAGLTDVHCNDNGTPTNAADDYLVFYLRPTGNMMSASGYNVSVEGNGTTITPNNATSYNVTTRFRLGNGSANGNTWAIRITDKSDPNCIFVFTVNCPSCSQTCPNNINTICIENNTTYTLSTPVGLTNVEWFDSTSRTSIGTGSSINIDKNTLGLSDGYESYFFKATNSEGCQVLLCCPVRFKTLNCFDVALRKVVSSPGPYYPGGNVTFRVTVFNQGVVDAYNIQVTDYFPADMTLMDANWSGNPATLVAPISFIAVGDSAVRFITFKINTSYRGNLLINWAEISSADDDNNSGNPYPADFDSTPDGTNFNQAGEINDLADDNIINQNGKGGGDEDDHDPAPIDVVLHDLALKKIPEISGPFTYGQTVPFIIRVFNQGGVPAKTIKIVDYIPSGLTYSPLNNLTWVFDGVSKAETTLPGTLLPGDSAEVTIQLILIANPGNSNAYVNYAEIKSSTDPNGNIIPDIDSTPDDIFGNDSGGQPGGPTDNEINQAPPTDEDDHDPAVIHVYDLALRKVISTAGPYAYGQAIDFRISFFNQGTQPVNSILIQDNIPPGYDFLLADNVGVWSGAHPTLTHLYNSTLNPGDSAFVILRLRLNNTSGGVKDWVNYSEIIEMFDTQGNDVSNEDVDSNPGSNNVTEQAVMPGALADNNITSINKGGEEDDHDPSGIEVFDLALRKYVTTAGPYIYGQNIDFRITVFNQGNVTARNIQIKETIPNGYIFNSGDNPVWSGGAPMALTTIPGNLQPGDSTFVTLRLKLKPNPSSDTALLNLAEISRVEDQSGNQRTDDIDSDPDVNPNNDNGGLVYSDDDNEINESGKNGDDEDDHDPAGINIWDLALRKILDDQGPYAYGDDLPFTITIYNQGTEVAKNIEVSDYIPAGYIYNSVDNLSWSGAAPTVTTTIAGPVKPGDSAKVTLILELAMANGPREWYNYSEITGSEDTTGADRTNDDVDSQAGSNNGTENGINPGGPGDEDIDNVDILGNQDEHDPAAPWIFDLATIIENDDDFILSYGENVTFPIKVKNQGNIPSAGYELSVKVPVGFVYNPLNNPGWFYNAITGVATYTVPATDTIYPGEMEMFSILLTAQPAPSGSSLANAWTVEVEISKDRPVADEAGIKDIDSTPDANFTNDAGGNPLPDSEGGNFPGSDDALDGNGTGAPNDTVGSTDEDDNDPEYVQVFDLALKKTLTNNAPYNYGQTHTFKVTVYNQGSVTAQNIVVKDYIPDGYTFVDNNGWIGGPAAGPGATVTTTIAGPLKPGDSTVLTFDMTFVMATQPTTIKTWINYSEIASAQDTLGVSRSDVDSDDDSNGPNENNVLPGKTGDDNITSNSDTGVGSQDDHDPAGPWIFDLATIIENDDDYIISYGENVTFPIKVKNQGNIPNAGYTLSVDIPEGFIFNASDNAGWTYNAVTGVASLVVATTDTLKPGEMDMFNLVLEAQPVSNGNYLAWTVEIEISDDNPVADEAGITDVDSSPDANFTNDNGGSPMPDSEGGNFPGSDDILSGDGKDPGAHNDTNPLTDEDDNDPEYVQVFDLALKKTLTNNGPYNYGQTHTFKIKVYNQGSVTAQNIVVKDYIPDGYSFVDNNGWTGGPAAGPGATVSTTIAGPLKPGDSTELTLDMTFVMATQPTTIKTWINYSEIASAQDTLGVTRTDVDSDDDSNGPNENNVLPGKTGDDDITSNSDTGVGSQDDHDPAGPWIFDLATIIENSNDVVGSYGEDVTFPIKVKNQGNIPSAGYTVSVDVPEGFKFNASDNAGWTYNAVTGVATLVVPATDTLNPGEMDMFNLVLEAQPASGADAWTVEIEISDDNPVADEVGITDVDSSPDGDFTNDNGGNPIPDSEGGNFPGSDDILSGDGKDPGAHNDTNGLTDEDDNDPEYVQVVDLALRKWVMNKRPYYAPGDTVPFTITVFNQGNVTMKSYTINDYMPQGYTFEPSLNPNWMISGSTLTYTYNTAPLQPVDSVQLTLKLKVQIAAVPTPLDWDNYAEIKSMTDMLDVVRDGDDVDSNPNTDSPWERQVVENHPWDNVIDGNGQPENEDEDDHDFEQVKVTGALGDKVWKDTDGDGVQDINEPGVPNVVVTLYDCATNTIVKKDTTDGAGNYLFDFLIPLKSYYVRFTNPDPEQCGFTFRDRGQLDSLDSDVDAAGVGPCTFIEPGERDSTYDAGLVAWASYGNYVWHDRDADGRQESGEEGIEGVTVVLYDANTNLPVRSMLTDANGLYHFTKLMPGNYYAKYTYHPMWNLTDANRGNDTGDSDLDGSNGPGTNATTYLSPDEDDLTWDVGLWKCVCIAGDVWLDLNKNGIYDWEEKGINGLGVHLIDALTGATVHSVYTGIHPTTPSGDGYFKFVCAKPGRYYIRYDRPGHLGASLPFQGSDRNKDSDINHENGINTTRSFTVRSSEVLEGIGGGFQIKAVVGDYVWHDRNFNGVQEQNEPPVEGVKVQAINNDGIIVSESTTGFDGNYMLDGLIQGDYFVKFTPPGTFGFTVANNGVEQSDSDVDGTNGFGTTKTYRLITGDELQYIDAGLVAQVLPLEWLSFEGKYNGSFTELNWLTGIELNNDHFVIERRHESEKAFVELGIEKSQNNNNVSTHSYEYDDFGITQSGVYYYRIKQVDRDGSYTYSKTIAIKVTKEIDLNVFIYPNPVDEELKIEIWLGEDAEVDARVLDENGKVVIERPFSRMLKAGKRQELLNTTTMSAGHYVLQVKTATGLVNKKFSVAR